MDDPKQTPVPPMPSTLRAVKFSQFNKFKKVRITGRDGRHTSIKIRLPTEAQKTELFKAFNFIDERLTVEEYRMVIRVGMAVAGFVITHNRLVLAYTAKEIIILNEALFDRSRTDLNEFAVTILHELLHLFDKGSEADKVSDSEYEARHDLATYGLLGVGCPSSHWAFKKYPHLLDAEKLTGL